MDGRPSLLLCTYYGGSNRKVGKGQGHGPQRERRERIHARIRNLRGRCASARPDHQLRYKPLGHKRHKRQYNRGRGVTASQSQVGSLEILRRWSKPLMNVLINRKFLAGSVAQKGNFTWAGQVR